MCIEALVESEFVHIGGQKIIALAGNVTDGDELEVVVHAKRRMGQGGAIGRQDRVGAKGEIAQADRRMRAQQDLARIFQCAKVVVRAFTVHLQMFRRIIVDEGNGLIHVIGQDDAAARPAQNGLRKAGALFTHLRPEAGYGSDGIFGHLCRIGDQIGRAVRPVLAFDEQIKRRQAAVGGFVGKDDRLARAGRNAGVEPVRQ